MFDLFQPLIATGIETALLVTAIVASAAGTGAAVYSSIEQGKAADEASKANQQAANANAKAAQDAAALEAGQVRRRNLLRLGSQRADAAKSGVLINDSASDVIYDSALQGELEAQSVLYSGATQATYYKSQGNIARMGGKNAKRASNINAGASLIGGLGNTAGAYAGSPQFKNQKTN